MSNATSTLIKDKNNSTPTVAKSDANITTTKTGVNIKATEKAVTNTAETKETISNVAETKDMPAKETVATPTEIKSEIYVQYRNREALTDDIIERVKAHYAAKNHSEPIEKIQVYLNIVESTAYYVINDRVFDKINMFA